MMQLARRASLVVVLVVLASVVTASAACVGVLGRAVAKELRDAAHGVCFPEGRGLSRYSCLNVEAMKQKHGSEGWVSNPPGSGWYREPLQGQVQVNCLPDTVDPRGPKGK